MLCGDSIENIDLEPDYPSDNLSDSDPLKVIDSDPLKVISTCNQTSVSSPFPEKLGDKSFSDVTDKSARVSSSSCNSSTTSNFTPQSNSGCQLVVNVSSSHIAADTSLPGN